MLSSQYDADQNIIVNNETATVAAKRRLDDRITGTGINIDDDDMSVPIEENHQINNNRMGERDRGEEGSSLASIDDANDEWIAHTTPSQMTTNEMTNNARRINVITTFCQYIKANLNRMTDEQIDRVIEDMTVMLFRRKRAFRRSCDARF